MLGHLYTVKGSLSHAVSEYHRAFIGYRVCWRCVLHSPLMSGSASFTQKEVLSTFSLAVSYLNFARNRFVDDRQVSSST